VSLSDESTCVAVCCSVLRCVNMCCSVLQCVLQCVAVCCSQHVLINVVGENKCMCMCADRASGVYSGVIMICRLLNVGSCVSLTQEPSCAVSRRVCL